MSVKNEIQRHQEFQQQLRLALEDPKSAPGGVLDVSFLTRYFALAGLPVRRPMDKTDQKAHLRGTAR